MLPNLEAMACAYVRDTYRRIVLSNAVLLFNCFDGYANVAKERNSEILGLLNAIAPYNDNDYEVRSSRKNKSK